MKPLLYILVLSLLCSCEQTPSQNAANVSQINGLYVFIESQPQSNYDFLGEVANDFGDQMKEATDKNKKFGERLLGALSTTVENLDFGSKLEMMIEKAKKEYPTANGIIIEGKMNKIKAIFLK